MEENQVVIENNEEVVESTNKKTFLEKGLIVGGIVGLGYVASRFLKPVVNKISNKIFKKKDDTDAIAEDTNTSEE